MRIAESSNQITQLRISCEARSSEGGAGRAVGRRYSQSGHPAPATTVSKIFLLPHGPREKSGQLTALGANTRTPRARWRWSTRWWRNTRKVRWHLYLHGLLYETLYPQQILIFGPAELLLLLRALRSSVGHRLSLAVFSLCGSYDWARYCRAAPPPFNPI